MLREAKGFIGTSRRRIQSSNTPPATFPESGAEEFVADLEVLLAAQDNVAAVWTKKRDGIDMAAAGVLWRSSVRGCSRRGNER